ncbi:MAG: hypothetical protein ACLFTR_03495 [Candidatus Woesearchaeota archaeon]
MQYEAKAEKYTYRTMMKSHIQKVSGKNLSDHCKDIGISEKEYIDLTFNIHGSFENFIQHESELENITRYMCDID